MPEISRFLGIVIKMYFYDHNPPHFHAFYGDSEAVFKINTLEILQGSLPPRVIGLVIEWAELNKNELMQNWQLVKKDKFKKIKPLV